METIRTIVFLIGSVMVALPSLIRLMAGLASCHELELQRGAAHIAQLDAIAKDPYKAFPWLRPVFRYGVVLTAASAAFILLAPK